MIFRLFLDYFNLGFPKSGTSSLQHFFEQVNIVSSHWNVAKAETGSAREHKYVGQAIYANYLSGKKIFSGFSDTRAITQSDVCLPAEGINLWPQFDESIRAKILHQYPSIKFILLKRDPRLVVSSIKCWNDMFFRFVVSDISGLPAWRGLKDDELLAWVEGHYFSIESQYSGLDNFISLDLADSASFESFLSFSGLEDAALAAQISEWPQKNVSQNKFQFDSSLYWLASDFSAEVKRGEKLQLKIAELNKRVKELKEQLSAKVAELEIERKEKVAGAERVKALEGELFGLKGECDARARRRKRRRVEELKQQLSAMGAVLDEERAAGAERVELWRESCLD